MSDSKVSKSALFGIRKMFVVTLVTGVLGICTPQYFNYPLLAVFLPLGCMVLYTGFGYARSVDSVFLEQFADSVYYLGFLFTLVALVVSLYFYQGDTLESGVLVANFSLALLTTITGLAVRIYINNFQIEVQGVERQVMSAVEQAANDLVKKSKLISMQLDVSHQETQAAIRASVEHAAEGMYQTALTVDKYAKSSSESLHKNMLAMNHTAEHALAAFEEKLRNIKLPDEIFAEQLNPPLDRLVHRLNESQILLKELNIQQSSVSQSAQTIVESMGRTVTEVDILAQSINLFNTKLNANIQLNDEFLKVVKQMTSLSKNTAQVSDNLVQQSEQSHLLLNNLSRLASAIDILPADMEKMSVKLAASSAQVSTVFQSIADQSQAGVRIGRDLQEIAQALSGTRETVKQISDFSVHVISSFKRLETFNQLIEHHTQLLEQMGQVARTDIDLAKQHKTEMAEILQQSRASLALIQQSIVANASKAEEG